MEGTSSPAALAASLRKNSGSICVKTVGGEGPRIMVILESHLQQA
jgi:hypothetical protein